MRYAPAKIEKAKTLITQGIPFKAISKKTGIGMPALAYYSRALKTTKTPRVTAKGAVSTDKRTIFVKKLKGVIETLQNIQTLLA